MGKSNTKGTFSIKYQISSIFLILSILSFSCFMGCGKKEPIGYEVVKGREGKIMNAFGKFSKFSHKETLEYMTGPILFAGKAKNFEAISFAKFKFDTTIKPETLWVTGIDTGIINIIQVDSVDIDSMTWSKRPINQAPPPSVQIELKKDTAVGVYIGGIIADSDSIFYLQISGPEDKIVSFYEYNCKLSIHDDTLTKRVPEKAAFIDTSYIAPKDLPDSLLMIQTGEYTAICSLYVSLFIVDSLDTIRIDSLTDSLRTALKLDSARVAKADFNIPIDTSLSYQTDIPIYPEYDSLFGSEYKPVNDSLALHLESIATKWFKNPPAGGKMLWCLLRGSNIKISRVVMDFNKARLIITYSLPEKERK